MYRQTVKDSSNVSTEVLILDAATGAPVNDAAWNTAGLTLWYVREGGLKVEIGAGSPPGLIELTALDDAHEDAGFLLKGDGYYRLDAPDAAFAAGAAGVRFGGSLADHVIVAPYHDLVDNLTVNDGGIKVDSFSTAGAAAAATAAEAGADAAIATAGLDVAAATIAELTEDDENSPPQQRFTSKALEEAPAGGGGGGDATEAKQDLILAAIGTPYATLADDIAAVAGAVSSVGDDVDAVLAKVTRNGRLPRGTSFRIDFPMYDASAPTTLKTGLSVTVQVRKDDGSFASSANAAAEVSSTGVYSLVISTGEATCDKLTLRCSASGAVPQLLQFFMEAAAA